MTSAADERIARKLLLVFDELATVVLLDHYTKERQHALVHLRQAIALLRGEKYDASPIAPTLKAEFTHLCDDVVQPIIATATPAELADAILTRVATGCAHIAERLRAANPPPSRYLEDAPRKVRRALEGKQDDELTERIVHAALSAVAVGLTRKELRGESVGGKKRKRH